MAITVTEQGLLELLAEAHPLIELAAEDIEQQCGSAPHPREVLGRIDFVLRAAGYRPLESGERLSEGAEAKL